MSPGRLSHQRSFVVADVDAYPILHKFYPRCARGISIRCTGEPSNEELAALIAALTALAIAAATEPSAACSAWTNRRTAGHRSRSLAQLSSSVEQWVWTPALLLGAAAADDLSAWLGNVSCMARDETVKATLGASSTGEWTMSFRSADRHTHTYDQAPSRRLGHVGRHAVFGPIVRFDAILADRYWP